jgi:hypothetical protein
MPSSTGLPVESAIIISSCFEIVSRQETLINIIPLNKNEKTNARKIRRINDESKKDLPVKVSK